MTLTNQFRTSGAEVIWPIQGNPGIVVNAAAPAWSAWAPIGPPTGVDFFFPAVEICCLYAGTLVWAAAVMGQWQIAAGAVVIAHGSFAAMPAQAPVGLPDTLNLVISIHYPIKPQLVPAGTQLNLRGTNITSCTRFGAYPILYDSWDKTHPIYPGLTEETYQKGVIGNRSVVYPTAAFINLTNAAGAWGWSPWVQFINPTVAQTIIRGVSTSPDMILLNGPVCQMEIGVGWPAPTVIGRVGFPQAILSFGGAGLAMLPRPYIVDEGQIVSLRVTDSAGIGFPNWRTNLQVEELV